MRKQWLLTDLRFLGPKRIHDDLLLLIHRRVSSFHAVINIAMTFPKRRQRRATSDDFKGRWFYYMQLSLVVVPGDATRRRRSGLLIRSNNYLWVHRDKLVSRFILTGLNAVSVSLHLWSSWNVKIFSSKLFLLSNKCQILFCFIDPCAERFGTVVQLPVKT